MKDKKKLIFFLSNFSEGGAGNSILKLCNNLDKRKYEITIISNNKCFYKEKFLHKTNFIELGCKNTIFAFLFLLRKLKQCEAKNTIFLSNINYSNVLSCIFIKCLLGLKLILIERTPIKELFIYYSFNDFVKKKVIYLLMRLFYRFADKVIVNSHYTKKIISRKIKCDVRLIYSPSINKIKLSGKKPYLIFGNKLKILSLGRLSKEKNYIFLIDAINLIKLNKIEVRIVGNGILKKKLNDYIKFHKLDKKVKIYSFTSNYKRHLKWSNLFINTSDFEGFPNSVIEALNYDNFILSRDSGGGIHDIIANKINGIIIKKDSPKCLANEIINFSKKKIKYKFFVENKKKKLKNYLTNNVSNKYELLINQIL
jgi:N-acetylgalactosamine-N,N'-diacetylbacillosaminyl-diphospho-undecaprenol 4-alpha-N-acetylgalactosaminyltransferase